MKVIIRKIDNALGIAIPDPIIDQLGLSQGDQLDVIVLPNGTLQLELVDAGSEERMARMAKIIERYDKVLRSLAEGPN